MIFEPLDTLFGYFKEKPYWKNLQPVATLLSLYVSTEVLAYQFIEWQYRISPPLTLFLRSYIFKQISLAFAAIGLIGFLLGRHRLGKQREGQQDEAWTRVRHYAQVLLPKAAMASLVLAIAAPLFLYLSPSGVSHIRVKFLREPDFNKYAFVYLLYELNKRQKNWYFEVDFDVFDEGVLTSKEREECLGPRKSLCYAGKLANGRPFIGITTDKLGEDSFWQNQDTVSAVSTYDWELYAPPTEYEFLSYAVIVQSLLIHLNAHCGGLSHEAFRESRVAYGDLFQFSPRRTEIKAAILAAHLSRKGEELLFNCFGVEYMSISAELLTMEWLHSERVAGNLSKAFGVKL